MKVITVEHTNIRKITINSVSPTIRTFPTQLKAIPISTVRIDLTWVNNITIFYEGIAIERSPDNITFTEITRVIAGTISYSDIGLSINQKYYYRVRYYKGLSYSYYSNVDSAVTYFSIPNVAFVLKLKSTDIPVDGGDGFYYTQDLKLRYSGGVYYVHTWYDSSGNNNHAIQTDISLQPVYDPVSNDIYFDVATHPYLKITHSATIDVTVGDVSIAYKKGNAGGTAFTMNKGTTAFAQLRWWIGDELRYYDDTPSGQINRDGGITDTFDSLVALVLDRDTSFTAYKDCVAGVPQAFNFVGNCHTVEDLYIGRIGSGFVTTMNGRFKFVCMHLKAYTSAEVDEICNYTSQIEPYFVENIIYPSTIDPIPDLVFRNVNRIDRGKLPLLACMHGWSQNIYYLTDAQLKLRANNFYVISVGMRQNSGASGTKDASGRELYDIYDAIQYCITNFIDYIDPTRIVIEGQSGGGGNVLGMCCKFPDLFNVVATGSGITDYGYSDVDSWYIRNPAYSAAIATYIGNPRATHMNNYRSRNAAEALTNLMGYIYMTAYNGDPTVDIMVSRLAETALIGQSNYTYTEIILVAHPSAIDPDFYVRALIEPENKVPIVGTLRIIGYLVTKRFSIFLNNGIDAVADVTYNINLSSYKINPLSGGFIDVHIVQGNKSADETINVETTIIVN